MFLLGIFCSSVAVFISPAEPFVPYSIQRWTSKFFKYTVRLKIGRVRVVPSSKAVVGELHFSRVVRLCPYESCCAQVKDDTVRVRLALESPL